MVGGMPSMVVTAGVAGSMGLPAISETAPAETERVGESPTVACWAASRVAVILSPDASSIETSSRATLPSAPARVNPEYSVASWSRGSLNMMTKMPDPVV